MKNSYSNIFTVSKRILSKTIKVLSSENVIALPTETVYGLAGNAYSKVAVKKIFKLKSRPKFNPLIIHYYNIQQAKNNIVLNDNFKKLYKKLSPGPITFILKKKKNSKIQSIANAKLKTVAVRFPKHKLARKFLRMLDVPLAAPSANMSSRLSPTCAKDVID